MMWSGQKNISFHARDAEIDPEKFKKSMHALINGDYFEKIYDVRRGLNFQGEMSNAELEVLFIRVAEKKFSQEAPLAISIKRDIFLASLGLLRGFDRYEDGNERRLRFVQESNYIAFYKKGTYALCGDNKTIESIKDDMAESLRKMEVKVVDNIADELYNNSDCNEYSESLSEYYKCEIKNGKGIPDNKLPSLRHPRKNVDVNIDSTKDAESSERNITPQDTNETPILGVQPLDDIDETSISTSGDDTLSSRTTEVSEDENKTEDSSDDTPKKSDDQEQNPGNTEVLGDVTAHKKTDKKKKRRSGRKNTYNIHNVFRKIGIIFEKKQVSVPLLVIAIIGMVMISVSLFQIADALRHGNSNELAETSNENSTPKIEMIHVFNKDITLRPNQSEKIKVGLYPHDADENDLNYISKNTDIATVDDLIVTAKDWQEGNNTTKIEVGGGNAKSVEVDVTVDPPTTVDGYWNNIATKNGMNPDDGNGEHK
ncbi:hypothetical protein E5329_22350 [Petralouisia muris]|uniref:Uncharacterized protein n=1 Tax=Petralouisia muris TaxID=3032872 RepID=A0AC61RQD9_9FIRM|nr:hypothetical protein [Petralouisia muris]TGY91211.1 hypothetical protein E5329_22350 [Petralouisia muris]